MACTRPDLEHLARTDPAAAAGLTVALCKEIDRLRALLNPPAERRTLMGCIFPVDGINGLKAWAQRTGRPLDLVRAYPAGKTGADGLKQVGWAREHWPGVPVAASCLVTGRADPAATAALYTEVEFVAMDAECDRKADGATTYRPRVDPTAFHRSWAVFCANLPNGTRPVLNLTGYDFTARIATWAAAFDTAPHAVLAVDPYWRPTPSAIQASERDLDAATQWAADHGVDIAWGEWGVDPGDGHAGRLDRAFAYLAETRPVFAAYFQMGPPTAPWDARLITDAEYAAYRAHLTALVDA